MTTDDFSSRARPWERGNPIIAGVLGYLVPGAGHLYQGRVFKGLLYMVCILATFLGGLKLGDGIVVYQKSPAGGMTLSYVGQLFTGVVAWPALIQAARSSHPSNRMVQGLSRSMVGSFTGRIIAAGPGSSEFAGPATGDLRIEPTEGRLGADVGGTFRGTVNGEVRELQVNGGFEVDRPISAGWGRIIRCRVTSAESHPSLSLRLDGTIPRPFWDAFQAPPSAYELQQLHGRLGKQYELALMFTWIAGLLNILATWDAISGPAYGFGDEQPGDPDLKTQPVPT